jgi:hypothetical protein
MLIGNSWNLSAACGRFNPEHLMEIGHVKSFNNVILTTGSRGGASYRLNDRLEL